MQPQREAISYHSNQASFHAFRREEAVFHSFWHFHPELELTYIESGSGVRHIGDNISAYEAGDLVLIGQNLPHDYRTIDQPGHNSIAHVLQFPVSLLENIPECQDLRKFFSQAAQGLHFIAPDESLLTRIKQAGSRSPLARLSNLLEVFRGLMEHQEIRLISSWTSADFSLSREGLQEKMATVAAYISEHYSTAISLEDMARLTHMTRPSFCRWFKQTMGVSFVSYLNATRIEKACQLLIRSADPIADISFQTGFKTVSHFNRTFKQLKRQTPKGYRNQYYRPAKL